MEKYGFVYIWFDKKRKMFYIGSHWGTEDDGYICSSNRMRKAYRRRPDDFRRKIISRIESNRADLLDEEYKFLSLIEDEELGKRYYNLTNHRNGHWREYPEKVKTVSERISHKTKEAMWRDDVRDKYLKGLENRDTRSSDPEVRKKRGEGVSKTLQSWTDEQRKERTSFAVNANKGSTQVYKDGRMKKAKPGTDKWNKLMADGWSTTKTYKTKQEVVCCPHCNKTGGKANMNRYHFENCKRAV